MNMPKQKMLLWSLAVAGLVVIAVAAVVLLKNQAASKVDSFAACKDAGGAVTESYPEQCMSKDGRLFVNPDQLSTTAEGYVGLTEQAAADKAMSENKSYRVTERDGQPLAVTMDFSPGRLNFLVRDGKVYEVHVEGE